MYRGFHQKAKNYFQTTLAAKRFVDQWQRFPKRYAGAFVCVGVGATVSAKRTSVSPHNFRYAMLCEELDEVKDESDLNMKLRSWLCKRGGFWKASLGIQNCTGAGRGLVNKSDDIILAQTVLLIVPWQSILTKDIAEQDEKVLQCMGSLDLDGISITMRLWLALQSLDNVSVWEPWLSALPSDLSAGAPSLPTILSEEALERLRGTALIWDARRVRKQLLDEWNLLERHIGTSSEGAVDWSRWLWAHSIVSTRSSTLDLDSGRHSLQCIIPIIDFANHSCAPNARVVSSNGGAKLVSLRNIGIGEEVQISYGDHSAEQFLFAFGFVPLQAPTDFIIAPLPPARTEEIAAVRKQLFGDGPAFLSGQPGGFRNLLLAFESASPDGTPIAKLHELYRFLRAWQDEIQGRENTWYDGLLRTFLVDKRVLRNDDLEKIRMRHEAILHAAIVEVEAEMQCTNKVV